MSDRITEAELGAMENGDANGPYADRRLLVAEVRRLQALIAAGVGLVYDPEPKAVVPAAVVAIMAEARAIREEDLT
jgi:hypothetical protein